MSQIAWLDAETDGLVRPGKPFPLLLEVALVLTDADLNELGRYEAVIRHPESVLDALTPHQVVVDMHNASGLWKALREGPTVPLDVAELRMLQLLDRHETGDPIVWGGFSPAALDRPVLLRYMPTYYNRIHHRSVDVSAIKLAMVNWAGVHLPRVEAKHRAMDDTVESVDLAADYRRFLNLAAADRVCSVVERVEVPLGF